MMTSSKRKWLAFCQPVFIEFQCVSCRNLQKKETVEIRKCIDQLSQNLATVHNLVYYFDTNIKTRFLLFFILLPLYSIVLLLLIFFSNFDTLSEVQSVYWKKNLIQIYSVQRISLLTVTTELKNHIWDRSYGISCEWPIIMRIVAENSVDTCIFSKFLVTFFPIFFLNIE